MSVVGMEQTGDSLWCVRRLVSKNNGNEPSTITVKGAASL